MTLHIKILGGGCANCDLLLVKTKAAVEQLGVEATFQKSGDPAEYARYRLLATPGLVIDGQLVAAGRVPSTGQIAALLNQAIAAAGN